MEQEKLTHGNYTVEIGADGCSVYSVESGQKVFLCGGISNPELAMTIVEGLILVEAKKFYHPEAARKVTMADEKTTPAFLKRKPK